MKQKSRENLKLKREFSLFFAHKNSAAVKRTVALITLRRDHFDPFVLDDDERESEVHFVQVPSMDAVVREERSCVWFQKIRHFINAPCLSLNEKISAQQQK